MTLKQVITKVSIATAIITIGLSNAPAKADSYSKKCTRDPINNRVSCHIRKTHTSTTRTGNTTTTRRSRVNAEMNISEQGVGNLINDLFVPKRHRRLSPFNHHRRHQIPSINY